MKHGIAALIVHCLVISLYFVRTAILQLTAEGQRLQVLCPWKVYLGSILSKNCKRYTTAVTRETLPDFFVICKRWPSIGSSASESLRALKSACLISLSPISNSKLALQPYVTTTPCAVKRSATLDLALNALYSWHDFQNHQQHMRQRSAAFAVRC